MDHSPDHRRLARAYRFLLRCYTPHFRRAFGAEMDAVFRQQIQHAAGHGRLSTFAVLIRELLGLITGGLRKRLYEHRRRHARSQMLTAWSAPMIHLVKNRRTWRAAAVILLVLALSGPWAYDLLNVPAQYLCNAPNVRLQGDFCGRPISLLSASGVIVASPIIFILPFFTLPIFTTLPLLRRDEKEHHKTFNTIAWVLAAVASTLFLGLSAFGPYAPPWGLLLYVVVTFTVLVLERLPPMQSSKPLQA